MWREKGEGGDSIASHFRSSQWAPGTLEHSTRTWDEPSVASATRSLQECVTRSVQIRL
jgi:hypothetical protein